MPFIAFMGCDGSGKSAVIAAVVKRLSANGESTELRHWRPRPFQSEQSERANIESTDPHGRPARGVLSSYAKVAWIWLNWWTAWFSSLKMKARNQWLLFDRFHCDMVIDPARYRYGGPEWLARWASRLMPQPDMVILLHAPDEVLLSRKQELAPEVLADVNQSYLDYAKANGNWVVVDASMPLEEVVSSVCSELGIQ